MEQSRLSKLKAFLHVTQATFYRLFISDMLPNLERIIYLDCDIIVEADLAELWSLDLSGCGNAGVIFGGDDTEVRLGVPGGLEMNAGILVMNLDFWRQNDISRKCIEWLERTESIFMDNDAMNVILHGAQKGVDERWNLNPIHFNVYSEESTYPSRILHFAGAIKPWHKAYDFDFQDKYKKYLSLTPWIDGYAPGEPWNISQSISVANQYYEKGQYISACGYYNLAFKFRLSRQMLESEEIRVKINQGLEMQSAENYTEACQNYREVISFWGFPLKHRCNVYQFQRITER